MGLHSVTQMLYQDMEPPSTSALVSSMGLPDLFQDLINVIIVYIGHKRVHALKFQSLSLPNGLIGNLYEPAGEFYCDIKV